MIFFPLWLACTDNSKSSTDNVDISSDTGSAEPSTEDSDTTQSDNTDDLIECMNDQDFFEKKVWSEVLSPVCYACHSAQGIANGSDLVLISNVFPDYINHNRSELEYVASLEREDISLILRKPLGLDYHGGGQVLQEDSEQWRILEEFVQRMSDPIEECPGDNEAIISNLVLASPTASLRKITLSLMGTLPSNTHLNQVQHGGERALSDVMDDLLAGTSIGYNSNTEDMIGDKLLTLWNDVLLTDKYMEGNSAIQAVNYDAYPGLYWYETAAGSSLNDYRNALNDSIAREPLELMRHVYQEDLPWGEILTANYTMVNAWSARSYGVSGPTPDLNDDSTFEFYPAELSEPQVGLLSTIAFLRRYPTTATNRNRHRSKIVYEYFLNTNILALADRPINADNSAIHNPTLNDPQCNVCHSIMEPLAGAFQNWDNNGHYNPPDEGWYPEMFEPGLDSETISITESDQALRWVAERIVEDSRFYRATVNQIFEGLTGLPVLKQYEWASDSIEYAAWERQEDFLSAVAVDFEANRNIKSVIKAVVLSSYFRTVDHSDAGEDELLLAGTSRLLTPEELHRKIQATTGLVWDDKLLNRYKLLYGGIDSDDITQRLTTANGVIAAVGSRMANDVACRVTTSDFILPPSQRRLFPYVEISYQPYSGDGFNVPEAQERIKQNIQYLFERILGEHYSLEDVELEEAYNLWVNLHLHGKSLIYAEEESDYMTWSCQARYHPITGADLPSELRIYKDRDYTIRAWQGVLAYMLADYNFLVE